LPAIQFKYTFKGERLCTVPDAFLYSVQRGTEGIKLQKVHGEGLNLFGAGQPVQSTVGDGQAASGYSGASSVKEKD
jgi:hypothetical protein